MSEDQEGMSDVLMTNEKEANWKSQLLEILVEGDPDLPDWESKNMSHLLS